MELKESDFLLLIYLGMVDDARSRCPVVVPAGCMSNGDRPGACRAYPVGRGVTLAPGVRQQEIYVLVKENHCLGFGEPQSYSVAEWFHNQGLSEYNAMNDKVMSLLYDEQARRGTRLRLTPEQIDFFLLAFYKLDEFKEFVSGADFLTRFNVTEKEIRAALIDEESLLRFAVRWLKKALFNDES